MAAEKVVLAVDLGAGSGRVVAGRFDGHRLTLDEVHRFANDPVQVGPRTHWNTLGLFSDIKKGIRKAVQDADAEVVSVGIDTWGVDYGLLDAQGTLLGTPHNYRDPRTDGMMEEAYRRVPKREIYETTGIQFMFFNTLFQLLSEVVTRTTALEQADRLLFMPDLLHYWLCGNKAVERTIASTSQLIDARSGQWALDLAAKLGIPGQIFGELVDPGTDLGPLRPSVADELGVGPIRVVAPGCHDTASAVAAVPAEGHSYAYLSSGTWSLMGGVTDTPVITDRSYEVGFTNEGGVGGTIRLLKNICGLWLAQESRRTWAEAGEAIDYADLNDMAAASAPFVSLINPDDERFASPGDMPRRIRAFCEGTGQPVPDTKGAVIRTVFESLALRYRTVFAALEELSGQTLDVLHVVGGGSQNQVLSQMAADALQRPVVTGPVEATSAGNLLMQLIADGSLASLDEGRALIRQSFDTRTYEPAAAAPWDEAYDRFVQLV